MYKVYKQESNLHAKIIIVLTAIVKGHLKGYKKVWNAYLQLNSPLEKSEE